MIDTSYSFETPEGVELDLNIAGPVVRGYAFLIDIGIRLVIQIILMIILAILGNIGIAILSIMFFVLEWFYPVLFEVLRFGQTPGKKIMDLKVVQENGTPIGWSSSVIRNLLRFVDFLPLMYVTGTITMIFNGRFQRLGDLAAGSLVVYADRKLEIPEIPLETPKNFPFALSLEEQQAVIALAERSSNLSKDRIKELVNILEEVTQKKDEAAIKEIYQVANGLKGIQ